MDTKKKKIHHILTRGVEIVLPKNEVEKTLLSQKKLRVKHGIDPTTPDLHLGYTVVYEKLRLLQEMGHTIVFIIGDFTARFGDPTAQSVKRILKEKKEVRELSKNYIHQLSKILNIKKTEIHYNSEWYDKMKAEDLLKLFSHFTLGQMLERSMFQERMKKKKEIYLHEPLYSVLQAYDSVIIKSDLTVIGTDQVFNELQARTLQEHFGQVPQKIIAMKILPGIDGVRKMSQSLGNYIGITEDPKTQYGKIMSIPDTCIVDYFELVTRLPGKEIEKIKKTLKRKKSNPKDIKMRLAREVVSLYYGEEEAHKAEKEFISVFSSHNIPSNLRVRKLSKITWPVLDLLIALDLSLSKSEARRVVEQKGVTWFKPDGTSEVFSDWKGSIKVINGMVIRVGKRRFTKIQV